MTRAFINVFRIPERRIKALLALLTLSLAFAVYRIGFYVPQPGIDHGKLASLLQQSSDGATLQATPLWDDEVSRP